VADTLELMDAFMGPATPEAIEQVRNVDRAAMTARLRELSLGPEVVQELSAQWDETRRSPRWSSLLAALCLLVERDRGHIDAPIPIWRDLDEYGSSARLLYYYLFALQGEKLHAHHRDHGVPDDVSHATFAALERHGETHRIKFGTTGVDAGWWMMPILRGEMLQVGSLKFHLVHLEVGSLAPRPWLDATAVGEHGEGFRPGDLSLGVHIPARIDLTPAVLDATFARAREVLPLVWPSSTRRLATCQSWMLDDRLIAALGEDSNIVRFQRRFELIEPYADDINTVRYFVFGRNSGDVADLRATSRVQRVVLDVLQSGGSWHSRTGWLTFDAATS
jgi:hypothetical protein